MTETATVAREVSRQLGRSDWVVAQVPGFAGDQVFSASTDGAEVILKIADPGGLTAEAAVCDLVRQRGVPAPEVLALEPGGEGIGAYLIMRHVGGEPVEPTDPLLEAVGGHLRVVHEVELPGFGWLGRHGAELVGAASRWAQWWDEDLAGLAPVVNAGLLPGELVGQVESAMARHSDVLEGVVEGRLLHGDVHPRHIYAQAGRLTGIIDWGDASVGDPLFDLGRLLRADARALDIVLRGYGELAYQGEDLERRLHLYAVAFIVSASVWEFGAGAPWPAWFDHQASALPAHLEPL